MNATFKTAAPILGALALAAGVLVLALAAKGFVFESAANGEATVTPTPNPALPADVPLLDAKAPAAFETATFALG